MSMNLRWLRRKLSGKQPFSFRIERKEAVEEALSSRLMTNSNPAK